MGRKAKDLKGQKFDKLTVIKQVKSRNNNSWWLCKCECGNYKEIDGSHLKRGYTKSCGCEQGPKKKHNKCNTRIYKIWEGINYRCNCKNINSQNYKNYYLRNIKICDEWANDFMNFYNWAINSGYSDNLTIDRIDNNGDYEPNNCRWVNYKTQANNRRNNIIIKYNNEKRTLKEWSEILGIDYNILYRRIREYHWPIEKAFNYK